MFLNYKWHLIFLTIQKKSVNFLILIHTVDLWSRESWRIWDWKRLNGDSDFGDTFWPLSKTCLQHKKTPTSMSPAHMKTSKDWCCDRLSEPQVNLLSTKIEIITYISSDSILARRSFQWWFSKDFKKIYSS